jgi:serine phosphatase RsbU (regulator of sigma subunit)
MIALGQAGMGQPAADTQKAIIDSINDFVGDAPQFDDITLMVVARDA